MDVEGAEYEILEYMLSKGTFEYVDVLYLEFHTTKVHKTLEDDNQLLTRLSQYKNLKVYSDTFNGFNFI